MSGAGAAFFDLDKTLMEGSSAFQLGRAAYKAGLISRRRLARDALDNLRYRLQGASDARSTALRDRIAQSLAGARVRDIERLGVAVIAGILPRLYPRMLQVAYAHQDAGQPVYIVTAAGHELAEVLAKVMAFDGGLGSSLSEVIDGRYTGRASGEFLYGEAKAAAIAALAERQGLDLAASYAYSDSFSDLPMLRAVGHPVVVNPDAELARMARAEGWEVMALDPLSRRLRTAAALLAAAAVGGIAAMVVVRGAARGRGPEARVAAAGHRRIAEPPPAYRGWLPVGHAWPLRGRGRAAGTALAARRWRLSGRARRSA